MENVFIFFCIKNVANTLLACHIVSPSYFECQITDDSSFFRCSERTYDGLKFFGRVRHFPFDDHNPPAMDAIRPLCEDMAEWLKKDGNHVAVVHCKAGKVSNYSAPASTQLRT